MATTIELKALKRWEVPKDWFGKPWHGWYVFLGKHRDSDVLAQSNFDCGLKAVKAVMSKDSVPGDEDESATVQVVRESHWAVGWVEWIAIHESDTEALRVADEIACALADYPVLDEHDFSQRESDEADEVWAKCYDAGERVAYIRKFRRQFDFRDFADLMACARGKYFAGYASELLN